MYDPTLEGPSRLNEAIQYVMHKTRTRDMDFILNVLYLADLESYLTTGKSITREKWYKGSGRFPDIPSPNKEAFERALDELLQEGWLLDEDIDGLPSS